MPARFQEVGDKHAGLADHAFGIEPLLELAERQEHDLGLGEMPWPPDYPKMPGEPMRVQPSRAKRPTSEEPSDPVAVERLAQRSLARITSPPWRSGSRTCWRPSGGTCAPPAKAPRTIELYSQSVRYFSRWLADRGRAGARRADPARDQRAGWPSSPRL